MSAGVSVGDFGVDFKRCRGLNLDVACGRVLGVVCIQISIFLESFVVQNDTDLYTRTAIKDYHAGAHTVVVERMSGNDLLNRACRYGSLPVYDRKNP